MSSHQLINQTSGQVEWYTPENIIEAARKCMGHISLDPFSCKIANETVKAEVYYDVNTDGWTKKWFGNVWCNYPFGRKTNPLIAEKCIREYASGRAESICLLSFASTSEGWFRPLLAYPQCYLHGRTNYIDGDGKKVTGSTKGSVVTYFGNNVESFYEAFKDIGTVKIAYNPASR